MYRDNVYNVLLCKVLGEVLNHLHKSISTSLTLRWQKKRGVVTHTTKCVLIHLIKVGVQGVLLSTSYLSKKNCYTQQIPSKYLYAEWLAV